ncbi:membrane protein DedA with SNARE-associated domain [Leifsonia sp. AK011]|uniref:DedA family protein n=1 Tax=Leifsonia sp. AK011 TaxID=2723075 RepID=UPI0015C91CD6|nr:DedA family protein [Leifsonia sp. AK011]NYF10468.1 membrane protein DedA with SNARE-associated domain [Leifsonia sp. AK011]
MDVVLDWLTAAAGSPWLYFGVFVLVVADAFTVILPSETVVVALASLALSTGEPSLWVLIPVAAVGAVVGDNLCYVIGKRIGTTRFRWMRGPRVSAAIEYARRALEKRPASLILTARYIPFARIAANLTAGATGCSYRRYLPLTVVAGTGWAIYNCVIGALFGAWLAEYPILAIVISVAVAIALGVTIDAITARWAARSASSAELRS